MTDLPNQHSPQAGMEYQHPISHLFSPLEATQLWLERAVIGLNLCPFAKSVYIKNQVRFVVSDATTTEALIEQLAEELVFLRDAPPSEVDTTLLIHPYILNDFLEFNDFLENADMTVEALDLEGIIQVASFHPNYQFADSYFDDIENCTNRSPYPTLHLLRENSITKAVDIYPDADTIVQRNLTTMQDLGYAKWNQLFE